MEENKGKENSTKDTGKEKRQDRIALFKKLREKEKDSFCCHVEEKFKGAKTESRGRPAQQCPHQVTAAVGTQAGEGKRRGLPYGQTWAPGAAGREGLAGEEVRKTGMRRRKSGERGSQVKSKSLAWSHTPVGSLVRILRGAIRKLEMGLKPQA